jgi:hypothetical protein
MVFARLCLTPTLAFGVMGLQGMGARSADRLTSIFTTLFRPEPPAPGFCLTKAATKAVIRLAAPRMTHLSFPPEEAIT